LIAVGDRIIGAEVATGHQTARKAFAKSKLAFYNVAIVCRLADLCAWSAFHPV